MEKTSASGNLKKITLLHSNDMHGDFMAEKLDDGLRGGVSMLSGYIQKVRHEEKNVLYTISGDMFRGSLIDSEYKGLSTIEIINMLGPDVVTLGNHEVDYGLGHLLFLEKCARFPIINANIYITTNQIRLFQSHTILEIDGMRVLFIGVLTEEVLAQTKQEALIGTLVDVHDAAQEVGRICSCYRTEDIDFTVLLTHVGIVEDRVLAEALDPSWGVDVIIGGHSHTLLEQPEVVNGVPIVQAVTGTDQIGRFDIMIDTERNTVDSFTWKLIPINEENCPRDAEIEKVIDRYQEVTDRKFSRFITRFERPLTHPCRNRETELGRLFADVLRDGLGVDLMLVGSGSVRKDKMGPVVDYGELLEVYPYNHEVYRIQIDGAQLKRMIRHIFRPESFDSDTELYQFSSGIRIVVSLSEKKVKKITFNGDFIDDKALFNVGIQSYHFNSIKEFLGLGQRAITKYKPTRVIATGETDVIDEYLSQKKYIKCPTDERWITVE